MHLIMKPIVSTLVLTFALQACIAESPDEWTRKAEAELDRALRTERIVRQPKNVIFFLGDGMGITTLTASRIYKGQLYGERGEEGSLAFEKFPHVGLSKTYNDDSQVPDSAGTATAYFTGQKAAQGVLGVNSKVRFGNCTSAQGNAITSILEWAQKAGKATGIVTTTRITHATPAGTYSHSAHRDWEASVPDSPDEDRRQCKDIARQMIEDDPGKLIRVIFGGGRRYFRPSNETDNTFPTADAPQGSPGFRKDGRNLIKEWRERKVAEGQGERSFIVSSVTEMNGLDSAKTDYVLGLFADNHLEYDLHRNVTGKNQPTLNQMTLKAIDILKKYDSGFFLMVEGGKIDHGHHDGYAKLALHDAVAFDTAINSAVELLSAGDTLFVVTADHSHTLSMSGYPVRGNPIMGVTGRIGLDGLPYTTLSYANGPGATKTMPRRNLIDEKTDADDFRQDALVPLQIESHGGEDVAIYAKGPFAHLFHTLHEQNYIPVAIDYAACYRSKVAAHCTGKSGSSKLAASWQFAVSLLFYIGARLFA